MLARAVRRVVEGEREYPHITDAEMKVIMKDAVNRVHWLLTLRENKPAEYARQIISGLQYARNWDDPERLVEGRVGSGHSLERVAGHRRVFPEQQPLVFDVELVDVEPHLWRRLSLRQSAAFEELHVAIQDACGWENRHMYEFRESGEGPSIAGSRDEDFTPPDAALVRVAAFFKQNERTACCYTYDLGDSWLHRVTLVATADMPAPCQRRLLDGARAFPPEDCGGIDEYERCAKAAWDSRQPGAQVFTQEARSLLKWLGKWHPEEFNLEAVRKRFDR